MKLTELFLAELAREVDRSRRALEQVPAGKYDWKPHEKSMQFGYLADMVATIPSWIAMEVKENELDVAPAQPRMKPEPKENSAALLAALAGSGKVDPGQAPGTVRCLRPDALRSVLPRNERHLRSRGAVPACCQHRIGWAGAGGGTGPARISEPRPGGV